MRDIIIACYRLCEALSSASNDHTFVRSLGSRDRNICSLRLWPGAIARREDPRKFSAKKKHLAGVIDAYDDYDNGCGGPVR